MSLIYFPSCKFTAEYPETSQKIKEYLVERFNAQIGKCCKTSLKTLTSDDTVIYNCNTCGAFCDESSSAGNLISLWELLLNDNNFPFPSYQGKCMTVQDCWRSHHRPAQHDAIRTILAKMNIDIVELENNREKTRFCGTSLYDFIPKNEDKLAPNLLGQKATGLFVPHPEEEKNALMQKHCSMIKTEYVVCYCRGCARGISAGGKNGTHLANLVFAA